MPGFDPGVQVTKGTDVIYNDPAGEQVRATVNATFRETDALSSGHHVHLVLADDAGVVLDVPYSDRAEPGTWSYRPREAAV